MTPESPYPQAFVPLAMVMQSIDDRLARIEAMLGNSNSTPVKADSSSAQLALLTTKQTAMILGLEENTLEKWRVDKSNGPPWIYIGKGKRSARYQLADVQAFIIANTARPNLIKK